MKKQILVSGLRASSQPHIGNYLGAIRQFVDSQDKYDCLFFIADLHTLTTPYDPKELRQNTKEVIANYLALGIDPAKCALFLQSQISEHSELAWILETITPLGELYRMTQFKDKSQGAKKESINAGLLNYPVLMAADILLYKAEVVPVGEDQVQHLELARLVARKFNSKFGKTFPEPKAVLTQAARVKSLADPSKKMSKTGGEALMLSDSPETIKKKLRKAVTATDTKGKAEGVENLFVLLKEFGQPEQYEYFEKERKKGTIR
ncbi:tryptophan--tRNA ligase, partial [Patescibacteria group bacterium]|nr:tryptophan--tRNA ligase [Patescibacteria group bacterium]